MPIPRFSLALLTASAIACASARKAGPAVAVYEAQAKQPAAQRAMPEGCRLVGTSGPIDQMESERATNDPYEKQRLETARMGGNVLLVLSERTVTRPNLDCPSGDTSPDCLSRSKSWYRVKFEQYACTPEAARELAEVPPEPHRGGITIPLSAPKTAARPALSPRELKEKLLEMTRAGVAPDVLLAYVKGQRLSRKMTAEDIIEWTKAGIPDAVIEAAASR
jgi:hypothetical protein